MTIEFFCPNEHQLSAPDNMAGKAGKCPRCGSKFLIPTLEELQEDAEPEPAPIVIDTSDRRAAGGSKSRVDSQSASGKGAGAKDASVKSAVAAAEKSAAKKSSAWQGAPPAPSPTGGSSAGQKQAPESGGEPAATETSTRAAAPLPPGHFMFLCPNNHKLNGPVSLKGKPGQCPHCNAKFRIPDDDEERDEADDELANEASPSGQSASSQSASSQSGARLGAPIEQDEVEEGIIVDAEPEADEIPAVEPISVWQLPPPPAGQGHRMAELFAWVWAQREQNAIVELTLKDDETFVPKWFAAELSVEGYGAFATEDEFGRYSLQVLPWDSVQRLTVRQLEDLPPQFE